MAPNLHQADDSLDGCGAGRVESEEVLRLRHLRRLGGAANALLAAATRLNCPSVQHLTQVQVEELRGRLRAELGRLTQQLNEGVPTQPDQTDPGDIQDHARGEREREQWMSHTVHLRALVAPIEAALSRIEQGTYGICEESAEPIPYARLRVQPTARYSVEVQQALEEEDEPSESKGAEREEPY